MAGKPNSKWMETMENNELHPHAEVWEKLPTETLEQERERIGEHLSDLMSRAVTIELIISERSE